MRSRNCGFIKRKWLTSYDSIISPVAGASGIAGIPRIADVAVIPHELIDKPSFV